MRSVLSLAVLCLFPLSILAAPPEAPARVVATVGKPKTFAVKYDKPFAYAPGYDAAKCPVFKLESDTETGTTTFLAFPDEPGEYHVILWTVGEKGYTRVVIVASDAGAAPPPKKNPPTPPDPPAPATSLYFLIVRHDGPASPAFTSAMTLPEWATLTKAGHNYKDKTATEAALLGVKIPAGTALPVVVVLRPRADGKSDQLLIVPFPASGDGITALPGLVK